MDVLDDILAARKVQLEIDKRKTSLSELERLVKIAKPALNFEAALNVPGSVALIAEMKKRSPSAGLIRDQFDPAEIARAYEKGGARALSVLTETHRFEGRIMDIDEARRACTLPILRKDFVFDVYQVVEARAHGADAVLLIADMVDKKLLKTLASVSRNVGLATLVEVFSLKALPAALETGSKLIGINTRNLRTLEMLPANVERIAPQIPAEFMIVAESGIKTPDDITKLKSLRVSAALVGESLLKQADLEKAVRTLAEAAKK